MFLTHVSPERHVVNAPFRECVVLSLRSKRFCAEDRGFLSEAGQFPFGKLAEKYDALVVFVTLRDGFGCHR